MTTKEEKEHLNEEIAEAMSKLGELIEAASDTHEDLIDAWQHYLNETEE